MFARSRPSSPASPFELTVLILAVIALLYFAGEVLKPLALAVLLSFALSPAARTFERARLPRAAAVVLTVVIALGLLGGFGYVVGEQLTSLAKQLPRYQQNIESKLNGILRPGQQSTATQLSAMVKDLSAKLQSYPVSGHEEPVPVQKVEIVREPVTQVGLQWTGGRYLEFLATASFVLVLVLFILMTRDDLNDRIIGLIGHHHVSLTTKTMEEIGKRISRYLATFALVNSGFGLVIGVGLALIGLPFSVLWGCLAAMLRFIPYVGSAVAFSLPLAFSFAHFPNWAPLLEVVALFGGVEIALNSFLEPVIYGKTTGVTALGLLVAAMFWTWLWGSLGLLLSTPLTVCLAVLGKYVPGLSFFAILLGEEAELKPDVRFYQRLVALDREGAVEVVESELRNRPRTEVFDRVLIPTLSRAARDAARDELDETELAFVWQVVGDVLHGLEGVPDLELSTAANQANGAPGSRQGRRDSHTFSIAGLATHDTSDTLALRMLGQLLAVEGVDLEILTDSGFPMQVAEQVADLEPKLAVVSNLPSEGLTMARYLVRRVHARFPELPVVLGLWGDSGANATAAVKLAGSEASRVVFTLAEARDRILQLTASSRNRKGAAEATAV
jgi:predicted PurR-regulated permease PerM